MVMNAETPPYYIGDPLEARGSEALHRMREQVVAMILDLPSPPEQVFDGDDEDVLYAALEKFNRIIKRNNW